MTEETEAQFYQPVDEAGKPLGLPIEYTDQKNLQAQLIAATQRMKFVVSRGSEKLTAPDGAPRYKEAASADEQALQVARDAQLFLEQTPSYVPTAGNFRAICDWVDSQGLNPELSTFKLAFEILSKAGLLLDAFGKPTTSSDRSGISYVTPSGKILYGRAAIDAMPADEYKRRINAQPGFVDRVERVLASK